MFDESKLGDPNNDIWIISNSPKPSDRGGPMSSRTSQNFISRLNRQGVPLGKIRYDYLVPRVVGSKGVNSLPEVYVAREVESLKNRILQHKPNLIFGLGNDVLQYLLGQRDMSKWRGHAMWSEELQCKVMFSYDPFTAFRQKMGDKKGKPGQYDTLLGADIKKAAKEMQTSELTFHDFKLIPNPSFVQAKEWLLRALDEAQIVSYDIEVPQPYAGRLMDCIGLCTNLDEAICIPFYIANPENKLIPYFKNRNEHLEILGLVKKLMESQIPKVAQNSQFDTTMLEKYYDIHVTNLIWDTMVVAHNLYCDLPKDLGTLISLYTNLPYHKYLIHSGSSLDRWEYNAADAVANLHVMQGQIQQFCKQHDLCKGCPTQACLECPNLYNLPRGKHYVALTNPSIESCVRMHIEGVRLDEELRSKVVDYETTFIEQVLWALSQVFPEKLHKDKKKPHHVYPSSSAQMRVVFYDIFKCVPVYANGKPTANKTAMKEFMKDARPYVATIAKACRACSAADAKTLKFKVEPDNGKIRTQYDVAGTDTGRLASKKSDVMQGGSNLQNIEKGDQRRAIIPEDDEEFCLVDLYAAEAYLTASDAGELDMLKMISGLDETNVRHEHGCRIMSEKDAEKYKIHNWMLREVQNYIDGLISNMRMNHVTEQDERKIQQLLAAKEAYTYKLAKQSIHGLNYNVQVGKMHEESGLPTEICQWQYTMYHGKFPGIKMRMRRIETALRSTRTLVSPLGRQRHFIMDVGQKLYNKGYAWPSQSTIGEITNGAINYLHYCTDMYERGAPGYCFARPVLNVHDGIAIRIKRNTRQDVIPKILAAFNIPVVSGGVSMCIPVSIAWGENFNDSYGEEVYFYPLKFKD